MKRKPILVRHSTGFTLVELLVVIVIIGALAALAFTMGPKMRKKGDAAKSVMNMRQIGATMGIYMADNSNNLPVGRVDVQDSSGSWKSGYHWHQALLALTYPDVEMAKFDDETWWAVNKPFVKNPLVNSKSKPNPFRTYWPGYAINLQISKNLAPGNYDWTPGANGPQAKLISLSLIPEPGRTPLVTPRGDWWYDATSILEEGVKGFLVDGKLPVLFVDGHVESMTPNEYILPRPKGRDYGNMPPKVN